MNTVTSMTRNIVHSSVNFLNLHKKGVKYIVGSVTFSFGLVEIYDLFQTLGKNGFSKQSPNVSSWKQTAHKVVIVCAKISLILSAAVSPPGCVLISALVGRVFSTTQLERLFGPNTIFAVNPWHPRHFVSIIAVTLALPIIFSSVTPLNERMEEKSLLLTDRKIKYISLFNTFTSRPVLHLGNQLSRFIFSH